MSMRCIRSLTSPLLPISSPRFIVLLCSFPLACSISPALSCPLLISHCLCLHFHQPCSPTSSASTMLLLIWIWACTQAGFCYWIPSIKLHLFFWLLHTWLKDHETHFAIFSWDGGICCWNCKLLRDSPADFQTLFNSSDFLCCGRETPVMLRQLLSFICHDSWCLDKLTHCVGSCNLSCAETWSSKGERPSLLLFASTNLAVVFFSFMYQPYLRSGIQDWLAISSCSQHQTLHGSIAPFRQGNWIRSGGLGGVYSHGNCPLESDLNVAKFNCLPLAAISSNARSAVIKIPCAKPYCLYRLLQHVP